jgi:predicted transcriptional regulator
LTKVTAALPVTIWAKVESLNPGGSVKDRIGLAMVEVTENTDVAGLYRLLMAGHNGVVVTRGPSPFGFISRIDLADFWTEQTQKKGKR